MTVILSGCSSVKKGNQFDVKTDFQYQYYTYDNIYRMNATEDEKGNLYYLVGAYVYKYDVKDGTNKPLCNKQNCLHDKEKDRSRLKECNAYFPYYEINDYNNATIAYENGYIYIAFSNRSSNTSSNFTFCRSLIRISADGSSRTTVHNFKNVGNGPDIFHRGVYYYTDDTYNENNVETVSVKAYALGGGSKEKTLYTFPKEIDGKEGHPYEITEYMAYGNYLYFFTMGDIGKDTPYNKEFCVNLSTNEISEIKTPEMRDNDSVVQVMFFNNKLLFYYTTGDRGKEDYDCDIYMSDLDGSNVEKTPISVKKHSIMYSDGNYLYISDDMRLWTKDMDAGKHISPDTAEYKVYDKELNMIDTYTEDKKDNMDPVTAPAAWYYVPVGVGKYSFFVKRNFKNGTAELYGGDKDVIGSLNENEFPRKKLASVSQSPAVKQYFEEDTHPNSIFLYIN